MADIVFNIAKGAAAEKVRDDATKLGVLLLKVAEADATLRDYATVALLLAGANTEANFTNYARKTALVGTVTVDNPNDRVDVDMPDQEWLAAGGGTNNNLVKAIIFYDEGGTDATRVPLTAQDYVITTDGNDLLLRVAAAGFFRSS